jgi:hypothetical protein
MFLARAVIVVALLFAVALAARLYRSWRDRVQAHQPDHPRIPETLLAGAARTWVLFTSPYCATCGPVEERLRATGSRVVKIDATREPHLAGAFSIRSAPTVLLADGAGNVTARLVGAEAVDSYVRSPQ